MPIPSCLPISIEQIRARIEINTYVIETPYVKSFNITQTRGSLKNSFSATVEIPGNASLGNLNGNIVIYAGTKQNYLSRKRFTGVINSVQATPSPGKPNYMLLNISGVDIMYKLENKKFSRRIPSEGLGVFVTIEGAKSQRPSGVWSIDKTIRTGRSTFTSPTPDPSQKKEHNTLFKTEKNSTVNRSSAEITAEPGKIGGDLGVHSHDSMNTGGPSFGVFAPNS
jgi:hypothetical protein